MGKRSSTKPKAGEWGGSYFAYPFAVTTAAFVFSVPMAAEDITSFPSWLVTSWIFTLVYAMVPYTAALMVAEKYGIRSVPYYLIAGALAGLPVALALSIWHGIGAFPILALLCGIAGLAAGFVTWIVLYFKQR